MVVLGDVEAFHAAVVRARDDDGNLALIFDEAFQNAGRVLERLPGRERIVALADHHLALAVIAERAGLEHGGQSDLRDRGFELRGAMHRRIGRDRDFLRG